MGKLSTEVRGDLVVRDGVTMVEGTQIRLDATYMDVVPPPVPPVPPVPPTPVDFDDPKQYPPNPNGYTPIEILEPQTPVSEHSYPMTGHY